MSNPKFHKSRLIKAVPVTTSGAKQSKASRVNAGLPRSHAPRNDRLRSVVVREACRKLFKAALAADLFFAPFHAAAEPSSRLPPLEHPGIAIDRQWPGCPGGPPSRERVAAIDFSKQADPEALDLARALGATTILRYYDWAEGPTREKFDFYWEPGPTLPGKTLTQKERDLIFSKGFSLGVVFQHRNDLRKTFLDTKRAGFDARRALQLAQELGQPKGSVIFFSVDFDAREKNIEHVKRYFETVGEMVGAANYRAGVYGDGYVCAELKRAGLASYCWLSMSTGFSGSRAYHASGRWDVKQCASREASGRSAVNFDPDVFNASSGKLPLWGLK